MVGFASYRSTALCCKTSSQFSLIANSISAAGEPLSGCAAKTARARVIGSLVAGSLVAGSLVAGSLVAGSLVAGSLVAGSRIIGSLVAGSLVAELDGTTHL